MRRTTASAAVLAGIAMAVAAPPASAEERTCRGSLGAITVDNLRVPQGATCTLTGTRIKGTALVERDATLKASKVTVVGNVKGEGARLVQVTGSSTIGGSFQAKQGRAATLLDSFVTGDVQLDANVAPLNVRRTRVGGSIQVVGNSGGAAIYDNRVDGNLQCKENRPAPVGGGNVVQGNKEDQCARL